MPRLLLAEEISLLKEAYRKYQLCDRTEERIEGSINVLHFIWQQHSQEGYWGFLLIGTWNAFSEEN